MDAFKKLLADNNLFYEYDASHNLFTITIPVEVNKEDIAFFKCPICKDRYKKNGSPYTNAKSIIHHHGYQGGGCRHPHCRYEAVKYYGGPNYQFKLVDRNKPKPYILTFK